MESVKTFGAKRLATLALATILVCTLVMGGFSPAYAAKAPKLNKAKATVEVGKAVSLKVTGTKAKITWSSTSKKIATVRKGKVKAVKAGKATIKAVYKQGKKKKTLKCVVTVTAKISKKTLTLTAGGSSTLKVTGATATWKSSNESVAKVSKGKVTAVKAGTAKITATYKIGKTSKKLTCNVTVKAKPIPAPVVTGITVAASGAYAKAASSTSFGIELVKSEAPRTITLTSAVSGTNLTGSAVWSKAGTGAAWGANAGAAQAYAINIPASAVGNLTVVAKAKDNAAKAITVTVKVAAVSVSNFNVTATNKVGEGDAAGVSLAEGTDANEGKLLLDIAKDDTNAQVITLTGAVSGYFAADLTEWKLAQGSSLPSGVTNVGTALDDSTPITAKTLAINVEADKDGSFAITANAKDDASTAVTIVITIDEPVAEEVGVTVSGAGLHTARYADDKTLNLYESADARTITLTADTVGFLPGEVSWSETGDKAESWNDNEATQSYTVTIPAAASSGTIEVKATSDVTAAKFVTIIITVIGEQVTAFTLEANVEDSEYTSGAATAEDFTINLAKAVDEAKEITLTAASTGAGGITDTAAWYVSGEEWADSSSVDAATCTVTIPVGETGTIQVTAVATSDIYKNVTVTINVLPATITEFVVSATNNINGGGANALENPAFVVGLDGNITINLDANADSQEIVLTGAVTGTFLTADPAVTTWEVVADPSNPGDWTLPEIDGSTETLTITVPGTKTGSISYTAIPADAPEGYTAKTITINVVAAA
jgi:predicted secreted protein